MARTYAKIDESAETREKATDFYVIDPDRRHAAGLPRQDRANCSVCTGIDHLVTEYSFGAMPHEEAELNMRLFADKVMPTLQRDPAFAGGGAPQVGVMLPDAVATQRVFAPA